MLSVLLKKQLTEIFRNYFYNPKTNKARSKAAVAAYIVLFAVLMVVILGGMFTVLSAALCTPLTAAGLDWLYFALMALLATLLGAFGSVFNTYSGLYLAKDNDLLLSMPIPVNTLMASRLLGVYLMGLMYSGVVMLPAVIVYWVATPAPTAAVIGGVLLAHTASFEAVQAVEGMFNPDYQPRQVGFFPSCTYCYPQVASVGKTERALKEAGVEYKVGKFPFQAIGKAVAAGEPDGFVKTLYGAKNGELLGAHIVGPEATELIAALGIGIQAELTDEDIHATIFAHPTLSEAIHESMLASEGIAIHM